LVEVVGGVSGIAELVKGYGEDAFAELEIQGAEAVAARRSAPRVGKSFSAG